MLVISCPCHVAHKRHGKSLLACMQMLSLNFDIVFHNHFKPTASGSAAGRVGCLLKFKTFQQWQKIIHLRNTRYSVFKSLIQLKETLQRCRDGSRWRIEVSLQKEVATGSISTYIYAITEAVTGESDTQEEVADKREIDDCKR